MTEELLAELKKYLVFKLDDEEYGIDIQKITSIIEMDNTIARIPKTPSYLKGVINLRGEIIPVISLRKRLGLTEIENTEDTRIVIVKLEEITIGFIVDSVVEVVELGEDNIENISNLGGSLSAEFILGVGKVNSSIVTLLNLERLIKLTE